MAITEIGRSGIGKLILGETALEVTGLGSKMSIPYNRITSVEAEPLKNRIRVETGAKRHTLVTGLTSMGKVKAFGEELNARIAAASTEP